MAISPPSPSLVQTTTPSLATSPTFVPESSSLIDMTAVASAFRPELPQQMAFNNHHLSPALTSPLQADFAHREEDLTPLAGDSLTFSNGGVSFLGEGSSDIFQPTATQQAAQEPDAQSSHNRSPSLASTQEHTTLSSPEPRAATVDDAACNTAQEPLLLAVYVVSQLLSTRAGSYITRRPNGFIVAPPNNGAINSAFMTVSWPSFMVG